MIFTQMNTMPEFKPFSCLVTGGRVKNKRGGPFKSTQVCECPKEGWSRAVGSNSTENVVREGGGGNEKEYVMLLHGARFYRTKGYNLL